MVRRGWGIVLGCFLIVAGWAGAPAAAGAGTAVDEAAVRQMAAAFLAHRGSGKEVARVVALEGAAFATPPVRIGFLVGLAGGGYLLFGVNPEFLPVKAFSLRGGWDDLPPAYRAFLLRELEARARAVPAGRRPASVERAWDFLRHPDRYRVPAATDSWLLDSAWGQGAPFNADLVRLTGEEVLVGCVNVAVAQIMRYWKHPARGRGVVAHDWNGRHLAAILEHDYHWERMPAVMDGSQDRVGEAEVARLLADLGVANRTAFSTTNSGTAFHPQVLTEYFGYSSGIRTIATATDGQSNLDAFLATVRDEIAAGRPMLFSIPGHMGVIDGFDGDDPTGAHAHVNLGWQGSDDGWYYIDRDIQTSSYLFSAQYPFIVYYGIKPCSEAAGDCAWHGLEGGDRVTGAAAVAGRFDREDDVDWYPLCLQGDVAFTGDRGYLNQAFWLELYDRDLRRFGAGDGSAGPLAFQGLAPGTYLLRVALWRYRDEGGRSSYTLQDHPDYTVTVSPGTAGDACAGDRPPVILTPLPGLVLGSSSVRILVDARDPDGDRVTLTAASSNPGAVTAEIKDEILTLTPVSTGGAARITVRAAANTKSAEADFAVLIHAVPVGWGRSFRLDGVFASQDEVDRYQVVLDGSCTIAGDNGYRNQAFFVGVNRADGSTAAGPKDAAIDTAFPRGLYEVTASLRNNGSFYTYEPGAHAAYRITVSCPDAAVTVEDIAGMLGIDTSGLAGPPAYGLGDLVTVLEVLAGIDPGGEWTVEGLDATGDGRLGLDDLLAILAVLAGG